MTTTFTSISTTSLAETSFIAGTYKEFNFDVFDAGGNPVDISGFTYSWVLSPYGQPEIASVIKAGVFDTTVTDKNRFKVYLYSTDTVNISGKFIQQPILIGSSAAYEFRLGQGYIDIIPAASMVTGTYLSQEIAIAGSVLQLIDEISASQIAFEVEMSGSFVAFTAETSASIATFTTGSYVVLELSPNLENEWLLTQGTGISIVQDASASTVTISSTGGVTIASASTVDAYVNTTDAISASSLAGSKFGTRSVVVPLNTSASLTTADYNFVPIPPSMNGWILTDFDANCSGLASKSGSIVLQLYKYDSVTTGCATGGTAMLSTNLTIGENEHVSTTFGTQPVISTSASTILSSDRVQVRVSSSGSSATYVQAELTFSPPWVGA